jgi:hypothetical protein
MHLPAVAEPPASLTVIHDDNIRDILPFSEFSDHLLSYSEDIIRIFGSPLGSSTRLDTNASARHPLTNFL